MCVVSFIQDWGQKQWPWNPLTPTVPDTNWTGTFVMPQVPEKDALEIFERLVATARELDEALGLADCEDPKKAEWLEQVRERVRQHELAKLEQRLSK